MRQFNNSYHYGMAGYLMDFGFGGFIGYGKGASVGLVMEESVGVDVRWMMEERRTKNLEGRGKKEKERMV